MNPNFKFSFNLCLLILATSVAAQAGTVEHLPVSDKVAPFVQLGKIAVFSFNDGIQGTEPVVRYEFHEIDSMLVNNASKMTFDVENGKQGQPGYFKAKYRVIYMTKPVTASAIYNQIPIPMPPLFGFPTSTVYVMGALIEGAAPAPKMTPWMGLDRVQLVFDK